MKKIIYLFNGYLVGFWFVLLFFVIGCFLVIVIDPVQLVIYFGRNGEFSVIATILLRFWTIFLLPLAVISIFLAAIIWLVDKMGNSYKGFGALVIILLSLGFSFLFNIKLILLDIDIKNGVFDRAIGGPNFISKEGEVIQTIELSNPIVEDFSGNLINTPATVKGSFVNNQSPYLLLDLLSYDLGSSSKTMVNQSPVIEKVYVTQDTKTYICKANSNDLDADAYLETDTMGVLQYMDSLISTNKFPLYYFNVEGGVVKSIYQSCL